MATKSSNSIIVLHWLEQSRAQRILWLLEELHLEYQLKLYHRAHDLVADPALAEVFPLGKSPILEIQKSDGTKDIIAESGHIINYLLKYYDINHLLTPSTEEQADEADYYLHFAEGTFQFHLTGSLLNNIAVTKVPFFIKPFVTSFVKAIDERFYVKAIHKEFALLEGKLKQKSKADSSSTQELFFVGNKLSAADIILSFPVALTFNRVPSTDPKKYPYLQKWLSELKKRPAVISAKKRVETDGNNEYHSSYFGI